MTAERKRIAIIGAGLSGIASIAALKTEGLEPVCFEATDAPGGIWHYREESVVGYPSIMPTTVFHNNKEMSALSNFPPGKDYSVYMKPWEALQFCMEYYKHFDCERHVKFNTEVIKVKKTEDYDETGRFLVSTKDKISGNVETDIFDGVVVATGHFNKPNLELLPGISQKFKGNIIHTHSLKGVEQFKGHNVLIVGSGCFALDAAEVISDVAKDVYISTPSGMFVASRLGPSGYPMDYILLRRYLGIFYKYLPKALVSRYLEAFYLDIKFDSRLYRIEPNYHFLSKEPLINDAIFSKLLSGSVVMKGGVKNFTEDGVVFDGEENTTKIDTVILATGYQWCFPFLEDGLLETEYGRINLYKCMYPTQLPHPTLVFIGFVNPFGPGIPISEMQSRWAAHVFAGKGKLPSQEVMLKDAIKRHTKNLRETLPSDCLSIRVQFIEYLDDIANLLGVKPNLLKYFITDFRLFLKLVFGPFLAYQYRLEGPHKWDGARDTIMTTYDRLVWPLTRENRCDKGILQLIFEFIGNLVPRNIFLY